MMRFSTTLIAVRDMDRSVRFYKELFGQDVVLDFGENKTLACGLALQSDFDRIAGFDKGSMRFRNNDMELYFETDDLDGFLRLLDSHPEVERVHEVRTFPWMQRGIRIYDPDGHMIEVSDSMYSVGCRLFDEGKGIEEVSGITQHPVELVSKWHEDYRNAERDSDAK